MAEYRKYLDPEVLAKISRLELRARVIVEGFISGLHKSPYHGFSVEFAAHREYVPGDDIRHIDWRLYGRGDRLYIKQYEEETNLRAHLLLDCSRSMAYPENERPGWRNKYDYAATLAAAIMYLLMHQQDACGLMLFDHAVRRQIPPTSRTAQLLSMIELIEANRPDDTTDLKILLADLAGQLRQRGLVVLISDMLADIDALAAGLQRLRHSGHDVIVLHVLDHDELAFPFRENTLFDGLEEPDRGVLADPQALRESYLGIVQRFISRIRAACVDNRVDYCLLSTRDPLDAGLAAFLAARMRRGTRRW
ncbi:MAG TPA: DUF58 domain-containing protein [Phycisphaerae bacterium]|nr:DUF58 domain-containing protein [Phycisphaerae bacterium]HRY68819.1 DUF58 domain-containing protein [Phycisphaerae bacterium]HSA27483.1 DUF58 domain-containing protein [Phycisphaerae bacterium]